MRKFLLLLLIFGDFWLSCLSKKVCWPRMKDPGTKLNTFFMPFARLGRAINKNKDQLGGFALPDSVIKANVKKEIAFNTETKYKIIQTDDDAKNMLDINGKMSLDLQLGIGNIGTQGAGSYMQDSGDRSTFAELMFVVTVTDHYEMLLDEEKFMTRKKCKTLMEFGDTHLITGFIYGGQCIISTRVKINANENKRDIEGNLGINLDMSKVKGKINGDLTSHLKELNKLQNVTIKTYCNANFDSVPTNIDEAIDVAQKSLLLLRNQNKKGVPIKMELTPLTFYKKCKELRKYRNAEYMDIYLESSAAMINDVRTGLTQLEGCVDKFNLNENATQVKQLVMAALDDLRSAEYHMRKSMRNINNAEGYQQFIKLEKLYVVGSQKKHWNYRYWTEYAVMLCNSMQTMAIPMEEKVDASFSSEIPLRMCFEANVAQRGTGSSPQFTGDPKRVIEMSDCFVSKKGGFFAAQMASLQEINRLEIVIPKMHKDTLDGAKVYVSDSKNAFYQKDHSSFKVMKEIKSSELTFGKAKPITLVNNAAEVVVSTSIEVPFEFRNKIAVLKIVGAPAKDFSICGFKAMTFVCDWVVG